MTDQYRLSTEEEISQVTEDDSLPDDSIGDLSEDPYAYDLYHFPDHSVIRFVSDSGYSVYYTYPSREEAEEVFERCRTVYEEAFPPKGPSYDD